MKELLGIEITDESKDTILNHYLNKAREIVLGYCNIDVLAEKYYGIIVDYGIYLYKNKDSVGIIRKTEGERTAIYEEGIPESIRLALPVPKIKVGC